MYSMKQTMKWFGAEDPVLLQEIGQAGCSGVSTALDHIPIGEVWTKAEILKRKKEIEEAGLSWDVADELPVHENIKTQSGSFETYVENYKRSLHNLSSCGIQNVVYNFSPLFNWIRTDLNFRLADGSQTSKFDRTALIAFDVFVLKHIGTEKFYGREDLKRAEHYFHQTTDEGKKNLQKDIFSGLSNSSENLGLEEFKTSIDKYKKMNAHKYRQYLFYFLHEILPVADEYNIKLALHPDDPPVAVFGLPRIATNAADLNLIFETTPSLNNGLCFCSTSLGARKNNDLPAMIREFYDRIHVLHLGNIHRGSRDFWETDHLQGNIDMYAVLRQINLIMQKREISIPMRCDSDTLIKSSSLASRTKSIGEIRGLEMGIQRMMMD